MFGTVIGGVYAYNWAGTEPVWEQNAEGAITEPPLWVPATDGSQDVIAAFAAMTQTFGRNFRFFQNNTYVISYSYINGVALKCG